jgi:tetratricopeptide (TPR) repeat protein
MAKKKGKSKRQPQQPASSGVVKAPAPAGKSPLGLYLAAFVIAVAIGFFLNRKSESDGSGPNAAALPPAGMPAIVSQSAAEIHAAYAGSESCRDCHAEQFKEWTGSHHQLAERAVADDFDKEAFHPHHTIKHATQTSEAKIADQDYQLVTLGKGDEIKPYSLKRAIGVAPLLQYLTEDKGGRLQAVDLAWDPHKKEWFNVYGDEDRRPGEWGHWTGRGMNWNAMCAACHNTRVLKNYDPATDTYDTKMAEIGIGCESCHGGMKDHVKWQHEYRDQPAKSATDPTLDSKRFTRDQHLHNCAPCHARRSELTGDYVPGENFYDHYSLTIPDHTDIFYPDGQIRDEDYEFTSFASSRMHSAGVRCMDCHNSHSGKLRVPGNLMCMSCHNGLNPDLPNIPKIDPIAHSFHKSETEPGGRCVDCHMPLTTYMQRHPRRDHGFTIPDPLLTKQFGIPNACNRCHEDKDTDWALTHVDKWYGEKMNRPYRQRAQWVAMAKTNAPGSHLNLITMAQTETNHLWRAVSANMMQNFLHEPEVREELLHRLTDRHALVRGNAVLSLEPIAQQSGREQNAIRNLLEDPVRKVRIDAAWALRRVLDTNSLAGRELRQYFRQTGDQPAGVMQQGVFQYDRQQPARAEKFFRQAGQWDTNTAAPHHELAVALSVQGRNQEAVNELRIACAKDPTQAGFRYRLGLGLGELGDLAGAKSAFEEAVKIDPTLADAWYNLGLALNSMDQPDEAIGALETAERHDRISARAPYARATILARLRRVPEAREAVQLALRREPRHQQARALWQQLGGSR